VEFPATVRFRYATPEGGKEYVSVFSVHNSALHPHYPAHEAKPSDMDENHEAKANNAEVHPHHPITLPCAKLPCSDTADMQASSPGFP
jgi:hypothetical protein